MPLPPVTFDGQYFVAGGRRFLPVDAQMISLALAQLRGHEAGTFTHARKVTEEE